MLRNQPATISATVGGTDPGARAPIDLAAVGMALIAVCYGLARFAYGLFVPPFRADSGADATPAGAVASGSYGAYCVAIVVATIATGRWGPRPVAVAAGGGAPSRGERGVGAPRRNAARW